MNLMNMGLLFKHHVPTLIQVQWKVRHSKGRPPQEGKMDASSEKFLMQKMLECVEA